MKSFYTKALPLFLCLLFLQGVSSLYAQTLTRGPYLQMGNQTGITIRWRTSAATNSRVTWGNTFGVYPNTVNDATSSTEHEVRITGLTADTKYYYTIGSSTQTLQATSTNYVLTLPLDNTIRKLKFLALGDCGNASTNQVDVKNAALSYLGSNDIDALLTIGDNAYSSGLDNEFQLEFFDIYKNDLLRNKKLYMVPGNHDYGNSPTQTGVRNNAYYNSFTLPTNAEIGGTASGTEAYYSYNIGSVHFVALDSYGQENANTTKLYDTAGAQCVWLKNDLALNTKRWTVVYFHHPPYTKTSHTSDTETDLVAVRERFVRILERYGVDLILCGHSHGYERSYLLKGYYKANAAAANLNDADFRKSLHTADSSSAKYDGTTLSCPYNYTSGQYNHGSVYIVAGSAGQLGGSTAGYPHDAMYTSNITNGGSFYFEVDSNRLDAKFLSYSGTGASVTPVIRDQFTIFKDVNKVTNITVAQNDVLNIAASWRGAYLWPANAGATTQSVSVNTATPGTYDFKVTDAAANNCLKDSFHIVVTGTLSVSLISFNAVLQKDKVLLNWATAQEQNNKLFTIEKSADGTNFSFLGRVDGAGTSALTHQYRLTDLQPLNGINYYRLSQTDADSRVKNLQVKTVNYKSSKDFAATITQVANGSIKVLINNRVACLMVLKITDVLGKEILQQQFNAPAGASTKNIQLSNGVYAIQISNNNCRTTQKLLVE